MSTLNKNGGGMYNNGGSPTLTNVTITGNIAVEFGGGIYNYESSPTPTNVTITGNEAGDFGGGMYNYDSSPTLTNVTITGNQAGDFGGGMYNLTSSPTLTNVTITGNEAGDFGGGIFNTGIGSPTIQNSIIWNNCSKGDTSTTSASIYNAGGSVPSISYSIVANSGGSNNWEIDLGIDAGNNLDTDPLFVQDFNACIAPSTTGNIRLSSLSPAIDAGDNALYTSIPGPLVGLDGNTRIYNGTIDMGAYEWSFDCGNLDGKVYVDASATGYHDGTSWANAYTDLQDALRAGYNCPGIDTILVAQGTYYPTPITTNRDTSFWIPDSVVVLGGFPSGGGSLEERDWSCYETILSGDINKDNNLTGNSIHVVRTRNVSSATVVDGFTITGGNADGSSPNNIGGGWYNDGSGAGNSSNPMIRNCIFSENYAGYGGALYNDGKNGGESSPVLTYCVLSENSAFQGGALYNDGSEGGVSTPNLTNCVLSGNSVNTGGAMFNHANDGGISSPVLRNCVISGNSAVLAGVMYNVGWDNSICAPILTNCVLSGNSASSNGGIMRNQGSDGICAPVLTNCIISQNEAGSSYPIFHNDEASPVISNSMFDVDSVTINYDGLTQFSGDNKFTADPDFVHAPPASSAPTTAGDFHLRSGSQAIDMGSNMAFTDIVGSLNIDLDILSRIVNGIIDMGAYEYRAYGMQDPVYLDEMGIAMSDESALIGELPEYPGCTIDTVLQIPPISCADTAVVYDLFLFRDMVDTVFRFSDTIWVLDTISPVIDMVLLEADVDMHCMVAMPDLSMYVSDNCGLDTVFQSPEVGADLGVPGGMVEVTLTGIDASGNSTTIAFEIDVTDRSPVLPLNCVSVIAPAMGPDGSILVQIGEAAPNATCLPIHEVEVYNQWGGVIWSGSGLQSTDYILEHMDVCRYGGEELSVYVSNGLSSCEFTLRIPSGQTINMTSAFQAGSATPPLTRSRTLTGPHISDGKINVYCGNIPEPSDHVPMAVTSCTGQSYTPQAQPDWIMPFPCNVESDTSEVIFRTWEVIDKSGHLTTLTDTIVVFRIPKLTPGAFLMPAEDTLYCELEAVAQPGEALLRYASWKQPVGLHDYERPHDKLRGVTYEIPATIILAGLANAYAQGPDVYAQYLESVILRKADGEEVTIGDIVSGDYATDLVAGASAEQRKYGILQILIELNEKPVNVVLGALVEFYPYLLLEEGDWVLSEGGHFEQVTGGWFYNGNGRQPYWFAGGWPSIYGSGECVTYCDVSPESDFGDCITIVVPGLTIEAGISREICDTICLSSEVHCGITITTEPSNSAGSTWAQTGTRASSSTNCPQSRGLDTWITQTCWAATPNFCAEDAFGEGPIECEFVDADDNPEDAVVGYECTDKAVKIHLSQWQTHLDTIGPIFDYCYPVTPIPQAFNVEDIEGIPNIDQITALLGTTLFQFTTDSVFWDHQAIQDSIHKGKAYPLAVLDEMLHPTVYRVGSQDCAAEVFVPDVQIIDQCSGVHSIKAMVEVPGGTRSVALEPNGIEIRITANGDTCYVHTYSHLTNPINIPFNGCDGSLTTVRYEAADHCWNQSEWFKFIKVIDDTPPTVVTNREVNVTLNAKTKWVKASRWLSGLNEGSWDNCAIDLMLGRRSDWLSGVSLCENLTTTYSSWNAILADLGLQPGDTEPDFAFLKTLLRDDEIEEYYYNQIIWLWEDGYQCGRKVVHAWIYALAQAIGENCAVADEHGNELDLRELETIFDNLFNDPGYGNELALLGGGWAKEVPVHCEDACLPVTGELLVLDACCNWATQWTEILIEDNSRPNLVRQLPDLEVSCEAYNIFYKDIVDAAAAYTAADSEADSAGVFAALDRAFGKYIPTWVDNRNRATDIDGNPLADSVLHFNYRNVACAEETKEEEVAVYGHDSIVSWETVVTKSTILDTTNRIEANGIVGINCTGTITQDVWVDLDECGQGTIIRRFFVSGGCGSHAPSWQGEQVIEIRSACGMRESMFDLPASVGTASEPICLPQGLSDSYHPESLGSLTVKDHLEGQLCNSFAIGSEVKELHVTGTSNLKKYVIEWNAIDWCAPHTSTNRELTYTQEVFAVIDPTCEGVTNVTGGPVSVTGHQVYREQDRRDFILYQNYPNPFEGYTVIGFRLPEATDGRLTIYDVTGKALHVMEGYYERGYTEVEIRNADLPAGVLYYQLDTERYSAAKKMVVVRR